MSEHKFSGPFQKIADAMGKDIYFVNLWVLIIFTIVEVGAVFLPTVGVEVSRNMTWTILIGVGIIKAYGIAAYFMHLRGDPFIYTRTALFPVLFVVLMLWGIGLSNPGATDGLPSWCTPNWDYAYVTE
jgi:heme/copper-type cytochrome/quinol oxidase subunit 4